MNLAVLQKQASSLALKPKEAQKLKQRGEMAPSSQVTHPNPISHAACTELHQANMLRKARSRLTEIEAAEAFGEAALG